MATDSRFNFNAGNSGFNFPEFNAPISSGSVPATDFNFGSDFSVNDSLQSPAIPEFNLGAGNPNTSGFNFPSINSPNFSLSNIGAGISGLANLANVFAGFKQLGEAKKTRQQNLAAFNKNLANQAAITNAQIEDRARRRARSDQSLQGNPAAQEARVQEVLSRRSVSGAPIA